MPGKMSKAFYITTTLPYVNADPHIGFAMEIVRADIIARAKRLEGAEVFFNTGTDEHGIKILEKAQSEGKDPKDYVDEYASRFSKLKDALNLSYDNFIRTTDPHHIKAAQEFWTLCKKNGFIYKKNYKIKYCVGCELEKTDSELLDGRCPIHPDRDLEIIDEENYFFKFSEFQKPLLDLYKKNPDFVIPDFRFNEIRSFVERGLDDFSISRLKSKMSWGVPVPDDSLHVMYVWFDALVNYISAIGWPEDMKKFKKFWPVVQYCGKDNIRQQAAMWQAMLFSVGLPASSHIVVDGFVNVGGQKMSKSVGNVVNPLDLVAEYGTDAVRYYIAREFNPFEDSDYTPEKFKEAYNANLANGLGNLTSRIMKMAESNLDNCPEIPEKSVPKEFFTLLDKFEIKSAADCIWKEIGELDRFIQETEPFKVVKKDKEKGRELIKKMVIKLYAIGQMLDPIMPETNMKIKELIKANKAPQAPLFLRKD
jgi:methionyl-tRNA synthetase